MPRHLAHRGPPERPLGAPAPRVLPQGLAPPPLVPVQGDEHAVDGLVRVGLALLQHPPLAHVRAQPRRRGLALQMLPPQRVQIVDLPEVRQPVHVGRVPVHVLHLVEGDPVLGGRHAQAVVEHPPLDLPLHLRVVQPVPLEQLDLARAVLRHAQPAHPHPQRPVHLVPVPAPAHAAPHPVQEGVPPPHVVGDHPRVQPVPVPVPGQGPGVVRHARDRLLVQLEPGVQRVPHPPVHERLVVEVLLVDGDPQQVVVPQHRPQVPVHQLQDDERARVVGQELEHDLPREVAGDRRPHLGAPLPGAVPRPGPLAHRHDLLGLFHRLGRHAGRVEHAAGPSKRARAGHQRSGGAHGATGPPKFTSVERVGDTGSSGTVGFGARGCILGCLGPPPHVRASSEALFLFQTVFITRPGSPEHGPAGSCSPDTRPAAGAWAGPGAGRCCYYC